jgi:glucosamine--fructose-6-phosphate aminotransferase (isomerizing)
MCGIFAYLNYNVSRERRYILEVLFNGLRRLEYRGYDSSGIAVDADVPSCASSSSSTAVPAYAGASPLVFRQEGKIENLVRSVYSGQCLFPPDYAEKWVEFWVLGMDFCTISMCYVV